MLATAIRYTRSRLRKAGRGARLRLTGPWLTEAEVLQALRSLPFDPPRTLLVHSSLSSCGFIRGGALAIIGALKKWNPEGTLAMPTHTYCYPDAEGRAPVYDLTKSSSRVGEITDLFWRQPNVLRSLHPTHSLACDGPLAARLVEGHERCDTPCGRGTPYERLVIEDAWVLMLGVSLDAFTLMHTAEDAAAVPYLYEPAQVMLKMRSVDGTTIDYQMRRQDMKVPRRFAQMDTWLENRGLLVRKRCGRAELLWMPHASAIHDTLVEALRSDPRMLVADAVGEISSHK